VREGSSQFYFMMRAMPSLRIGPYRFHFYASDRGEPAHVHVLRERSEAKFWLNPVLLERNFNFRARELQQIERLVVENEETLLRMWDEYFYN
jgi:hypothetical protein